ncbi:hypothetical protein FZI85_24910 [Mycobacterium sp. CBMA293]|uniref:hypothetical protein n=1 Tax=unclassified Mycolicibacterium TaxID=2636767 RepID=UPI0012DDB9A0|nr:MULTISPECIES: hypothetical protein [unclassified Mycolicibacterium]MUL50024.1 hypothetical protein [Mycolicibacterium sp. CBMA 360]MUL61920.1 hypothetical protein [Mycolicibacterium sp. CBMA 335]MUL72595.1 hypothetical protein [Mycolicibacterium sp. CBMA 311]MUL92790.1 hypothetical protein [Mycolicibacterium sp. CBMA 230]MUM14254.1 hypothetical protein [Mycolicibacterium sp. CBMA 293]
MISSKLMGKAAAAGMLAAAASIAFAGSASADWNSPVPMPGSNDQTDSIANRAAEALGPAPLADANMPVLGAPLGAAGVNVLGQRSNNTDPAAVAAPAGVLGMPQGAPGLSADTVLGQNAAPSAPGAGGGAGTVPNLNPFNNAYGVQQCLKPSAPGKCEEFGVDPGEENANISPHDWLHRYIDMYHDGRLRGGSLSQLSQQQLGEPLPGTAPLPGTNIPPGMFYDPADPAVPPAPGAPVPPGAPAPPAPAAPAPPN